MAPVRSVKAGGKTYSPDEVQALLEKLASMGQGRDRIIAQINPDEARLLKSRGGSGEVNPRTGLLSFDDSGDDGSDGGGYDDGGYDDGGYGGFDAEGFADAVNANNEAMSDAISDAMGYSGSGGDDYGLGATDGLGGSAIDFGAGNLDGSFSQAAGVGEQFGSIGIGGGYGGSNLGALAGAVSFESPHSLESDPVTGLTGPSDPGQFGGMSNVDFGQGSLSASDWSFGNGMAGSAVASGNIGAGGGIGSGIGGSIGGGAGIGEVGPIGESYGPPADAYASASYNSAQSGMFDPSFTADQASSFVTAPGSLAENLGGLQPTGMASLYEPGNIYAADMQFALPADDKPVSSSFAMVNEPAAPVSVAEAPMDWTLGEMPVSSRSAPDDLIDTSVPSLTITGSNQNYAQPDGVMLAPTNAPSGLSAAEIMSMTPEQMAQVFGSRSADAQPVQPESLPQIDVTASAPASGPAVSTVSYETNPSTGAMVPSVQDVVPASGLPTVADLGPPVEVATLPVTSVEPVTNETPVGSAAASSPPVSAPTAALTGSAGVPSLEASAGPYGAISAPMGQGLFQPSAPSGVGAGLNTVAGAPLPSMASREAPRPNVDAKPVKDPTNFSGKAYSPQVYNTPIDTRPGLAPQTMRDQIAMARAIIGEARNQDRAGMVAVANVVANRALAEAPTRATDRSSIADQANARAQFSWHNNGGDPSGSNRAAVGRAEAANSPMWQQAMDIAAGVISGRIGDNTQGATHYHTHAINPSWANSSRMVPTGDIGAHTFYRDSGWMRDADLTPPANIPNVGPRADANTGLLDLVGKVGAELFGIGSAKAAEPAGFVTDRITGRQVPVTADGKAADIFDPNATVQPQSGKVTNRAGPMRVDYPESVRNAPAPWAGGMPQTFTPPGAGRGAMVGINAFGNPAWAGYQNAPSEPVASAAVPEAAGRFADRPPLDIGPRQSSASKAPARAKQDEIASKVAAGVLNAAIGMGLGPIGAAGNLASYLLTGKTLGSNIADRMDIRAGVPVENAGSGGDDVFRPIPPMGLPPAAEPVAVREAASLPGWGRRYLGPPTDPSRYALGAGRSFYEAA